MKILFLLQNLKFKFMKKTISAIPPISLLIKIENKQPVELLDLTKSLISLSSQFDSYVSANCECKEEREAKLYVKQVKSGSIIIELVEFATIGMLPFLENSNIVIEFASHLKDIFKYFVKGEGEKPVLTLPDYKDLSGILNTVTKDNGAKLEVSVVNNGVINNYLYLDSTESNAAQNRFQREIQGLKEPEEIDKVYEKQLMTWYQARNDKKSKMGNKGIIDRLNKKPLNVIFNNDDIKDKMLHGDINFFKTAYVVDVIILTLRGVPSAYKIMKLHQSFDLD